MSAWYESLESQLRWEFYTELMKIVQPSPQEWRNLNIRPIKVITKLPQSGSKGAGLAHDKQDVRTEDNNGKGKS